MVEINMGPELIDVECLHSTVLFFLKFCTHKKVGLHIIRVFTSFLKNWMSY